MAELDNPIEVSMKVEEVKVVEAVSPRYKSATHEGDHTKVIIEDIGGQHAIYFPDGQPGRTPVRGVDYWTPGDKSEIAAQAARGIAGKVTSLTETELAAGEVIEAAGIPVYVGDVSAYAAYGLTDTGWYVFARIHAETGTVVTEQTAVTGAAGAILAVGSDHVDVAVRFGVAAESCKVTVEWDSYTDVFVFKATDLAVRNLDYRTTFYVYDLAEFVTWQYALTSDATFVADKKYFTLADGVYTLAEVTAGEAVPENTYYNHSKVVIQGMTRNITYRLDEVIDCASEVILPAVEDETHGCWFEFQLQHSGKFSMTLTPPTGVIIATEHTQAEDKGFNLIDLHYMSIAGVKMWRFMNTHSSIPT